MAHVKMLLTSFVILALYTPTILTKPGAPSEASHEQARHAMKLVEKHDSNATLTSENLKIESVQIQVVAGTNYIINFRIVGTGTRCQVIIFEQIWTDTEQVTTDTCSAQVSQKKRSTLVGGVENVDENDEGVLKAADFALDEINHRSNSMHRMVRTRMVSATSQVVAGIKYTMEFETQQSTCDNTVKTTLEGCALDDAGSMEHCKVSVWEQDWMTPAYTLLEGSNCTPRSPVKRSRRSPTHNTDAVMDQGLLGGDGHDIGNYGAFQDFKQQYGRHYASVEEEKARFLIFQDNMRLAAKMQQTEKATARYGATQFADVSREEFEKFYTSGQWDLTPNPALKIAEIPSTPAPAEYDWRNHSAVSEVKNQGTCGSCWAFSTTGNIEGQWAIKKGKLLSLSEQELVDCDKVDEGCNGGLPSNAYQEIMRIGGLETETKYPYDGRDESCKFKVSDARVYINSSLNISTNEADMAAWLAEHGPISIGINAMAMQFYMGGISHPWKIFCNPEKLDHGVLIVGYGTQSDTPYWIVKNSWGESWGEKGYYLVYRGAGVCGLNKMPTSAVVN